MVVAMKLDWFPTTMTVIFTVAGLIDLPKRDTFDLAVGGISLFAGGAMFAYALHRARALRKT
jgi:hypothetical protein